MSTHGTSQGWFGPADVVEDFLRGVGADRDVEGRFMIHGPDSVVSFMGAGDELVIPETAMYFVHGESVPLVANLVQVMGLGSGRGMSVVVI